MTTMKYEGGYIPQNERQDENARACLGFRDIPKQIRYTILKAHTCNLTHSYIDRAYRVRAMRSLSLSGTVIWSRSRRLFKVVSCRVRAICATEQEGPRPDLEQITCTIALCPVFPFLSPFGRWLPRPPLYVSLGVLDTSTPPPSLLSDPFVCACTPPHGPRRSKSHCIEFVME